MPRADGFPTNIELMSLYEQRARDVFVTAFEREHEGHLDPLYEDKPLANIIFTTVRGATDEVRAIPLNVVVQERLDFQPSDSAALIREHVQWGKHPEVMQYREEVARLVGSTTLTNSFRAAGLPSEAVNTTYGARLKDGGYRLLQTDLDKPAKLTIYAALGFLEETAAYVQSDEYEKPLLLRYIEDALEVEPAETDIITHKWSLMISRDLPLNGHEPVWFLEEFYRSMTFHAAQQIKHIEQMKKLALPEALIKDAEKAHAEAQAAARKAAHYLSSRN